MSLVIVFFLLLLGSTVSENTLSRHQSKGSSISPIEEFIFTANSVLELTVSSIKIHEDEAGVDFSKLGFILTSRRAWFSELQKNKGKKEACLLLLHALSPVFTLDKLNRSSDSKLISFPVDSPREFSLLFANCVPSLDVMSSIHRVEKEAAELHLFFFSLAYLTLSSVLAVVLYKRRFTASRIHYYFLSFVVLRAVILFCEAEFESRFVFVLLNGLALSILLMIIRLGWCFIRLFLEEEDEKVLSVVIPLQVLLNVAQVFAYGGWHASTDFMDWKKIHLLADVACFCIVILILDRSVRGLRDAAQTDEKAALNTRMVDLFLDYYAVVLCYVYVTWTGAYALALVVSYRYLWMIEVAKELGTLAFLAFTCHRFRPREDSLYLKIMHEEEDTREPRKAFEV